MATTKRYCAKMMYLGHNYSGYQKQNEVNTIQGSIEDALKTVFRHDVEIVGCGRTDTGVSAKEYYFHFDTDFDNPLEKLFSINGILGTDIVIQSISPVSLSFHARYDATLRGYEYHVHTQRNPFLQDSSFFLPLGLKSMNYERIEEAARLILNFNDFYTFCKTNSDVNSTLCTLSKSEWEIGKDRMTYIIQGNRFLRGMVRLIVGSLLNIGLGKLSIDDLEKALKNKTRLDQSWSVPAHGLYLNLVKYPEGSLGGL